ncbi:MAG: hypothetical protein J6386_00805 [Candidatus Synoicihabitans palmerolidicus]|nr:hypothetical protein [Candidatus Synoicihabitans palmerolidicus]
MHLRAPTSAIGSRKSAQKSAFLPPSKIRVNGTRRSSWGPFLEELKQTPQASGVVIKDAMRQSFRQTTAESIGMIQVLYSTFATVVAFGIV